ncbi:MAG: CheR family methyltransferase [Verrucomicrobiota bacterium]
MISEDTILEDLRAHAGIDAAQTGEVSLRKEIRRLIAACPQPVRLLDTTSAEWKVLLEAALVPETWFFRNIEAFDAMADWVTGTWLPAHPGGCLRVLSLPCATGEEPYAIAMRLLEAGLAPDLFKIHAGDISEVSLGRAAEAIYRRNSFRSGFDAARYGKYFDDLGDGAWRITPAIRKLVEFDLMNLVKSAPALPRSDVIFCRNALIYFGQTTQLEVVSHLHAALSDDGILFLGPVEPPVALQCGFVTARLPMAFACVKHPATAEIPKPKPQIPKPKARIPNPQAPVLNPRSQIATSVTTAVGVVDSLEVARGLADGDGEAAAADMLDRMAASVVSCPEYFCLRGVVSDALGRSELAETYYRKALYLDPEHTETLAQFALHLDLTGRAAAAAQMRRRAHHLAAR